MIYIPNESRQLTIAAVQLVGVALIYLFLARFYIPTFGVIGGCLDRGWHGARPLDGRPLALVRRS